LSILLLSCKQKFNVITSLYAFPKKLKEVSGITYIPESKLLWVMKIVAMPKIYGLNPKGKLEKHHYQNAENIDWEEITKDKEGNLYIGDFGNNENKEIYAFIKLQRDSLLKTLKPLIKFHLGILNKKVSIKRKIFCMM
jgi:hypothetical protein